MKRWTLSTLTVVSAAGTLTAWHSCLLQAHHMVGLPVPDLEPTLFAVSIVPSILFLAAWLIGRRSVGMQSSTAVASVLVASLRICVIRFELSRDWTHGTGLLSGAAWMLGTAGAAIVTMIAVVSVACESVRRRHSPEDL